MNRLDIRALLAFLVLLGSLGCCAAPPTEIPTLGQKLGIPQSIFRVKDNRLNRSGNRPWRERKPKLLRLADPKNLEPGMPEAVKVAAAIKQQEDLAPQKIKALKYLGMIGCGCYDANKEMEKALAESLKDCNPCVRLAAIEAIGTSVDECNRQAMKFNKKREDCGGRPERECHCKTKGCRGCSECSYEQVVAEYCNEGYPLDGLECEYCLGQGCSSCQSPIVDCECVSGCSSCGGCNSNSCCSKEIQKILGDIAYGKDDFGCWLEPLEEIRNAAAAVLAMCPPLPVVPEEPEPKPIKTEGEDTEGEDKAEGEGGDADESDDGGADAEENTGSNAKAEDVKTTSSTNSDLLQIINAKHRQQTAQAKATARTPKSTGPEMNPNLIMGRLQQIENGLLYINFEKTYELPENSRVVVVAENGFEQVMQILTSAVGQVVVHPTEQSNLPVPWRTGSRIFVGVLAR